ncbi:hypothetical protein B9G53_12025 [Pseudanabaena sp. SR411]|uniref:WD40/YVTN/BNR-like repeat-containing protein n=1 Tax=Pseudanabaena sp. SR411 TaxID=1980935 RepID=UPI000B98FBD9|nr:hypothetical protein [Pseudanabaena sp. SR411]OYQ64425.1 hypothetical protein B9G53_12025 [Pseudanabaena sp. SR411]
MSVQQDLRTTLRDSVENSHSSSVAAVDTQVIGLDDLTALLLVTIREAKYLNSSAERIRTIVVKTTDGGKTWRETLNADRGSVNPDELFFVDENHFWMITQWQIAGTYPTLYWTSDFGTTWQESDAINKFLFEISTKALLLQEAFQIQRTVFTFCKLPMVARLGQKFQRFHVGISQ